MDRYFRKLIDITKEDICKQAAGVQAANQLVPVSGQRHTIVLNDRSIDIVYYPALNEDGSAAEGTFPLVVGYHGGGFIFGGCALDDEMWVAVTKKLRVNVAAIGYRMAPEFQWKETLDDAYDALAYLTTHADDFGFDANHISVMGQSAGGNLAAAVTLLANQNQLPLDNMILVYPFLDVHTEPNEKGGGSLEGPVCYAMNELHCSAEDTLNPLVSPVFAAPEMLKGSPNTIVALCENDNLKYEGARFAQMLRDAGASVAEQTFKNMPHGFFENGFKTPSEREMKMLLGENGPELFSTGMIAAASEACLEFIKENMKS